MSPRRSSPASPAPRAFTLIEVLIATLIFAAILVAINAAFSAALHLRSTTARAVDDALPVNHAVEILKADLAGMMVPNPSSLTNAMSGGLSGSTATPNGSTALAGPILGLSGAVGNSQLRFYTTTGIIAEEEPGGENAQLSVGNNAPPPWPDVQMVQYYLRAPFNPANVAGKDLVRGVTRNLLASTQPVADEEPLLTGVSSFTVAYFDGSLWQNTWDSTTATVSIPQAVKVDIQFATTNASDPGRLPVRIVVPLDMQPTNAATAGASSTGITSN
jgi:prepilin-type N-terminal cleavage/methylation domain-containing protein